MREYRVLVVDDEPHAREGLAALVSGEEGWRVAGMAADGPSAVTSILELKPDVVLLDIQMPGMTGLDVIATIGTKDMPYVIFVTAHDRYALAAFEHAAIDYVLKPFKDARLVAALARARDALTTRHLGEVGQRLLSTLGELGVTGAELPPPQPAQPPERITRFHVRTGNRLTVVSADEVDWIEAANYCARLHAGDQVYVVRLPMLELESRLDPEVFIRVHRSHIVRRDRLLELRRSGAGEHGALLTTGARVPVGRNRWSAVVASLRDTKTVRPSA